MVHVAAVDAPVTLADVKSVSRETWKAIGTGKGGGGEKKEGSFAGPRDDRGMKAAVDTFHNQWQAYRTRKEPKIELETKYEYKESGKYQVVVKVIDILGNDTTKTVEVVVG